MPFLRAMHGGDAHVLCEDFCGTAALSRAWCEMVRGGRAIGVDLSDEVLERGRRDKPESLTLRKGDATRSDDRGDIVFVGNFSIGEIHERPALVRYLARCRRRLHEGGIFVCDTYGGESALREGFVHRPHPLGDGRIVRYTWEQREVDPLTNMVINAMHFRIERAGVIEEELTDAFVYHWRLWSVPELRDAMRQAGFDRVEVYEKLPDAVDDDGNAHVLPIHDVEDPEGFIVCVCGRA